MPLPTSVTLFIVALTSVLLVQRIPFCRAQDNNVTQTDIDLMEVALNLEFLKAEYFMYGSQGYGLDMAAPELTGGGPRPIGARQANLDNFTRDIFYQFALQAIGHLRAIQNTIPGFPRPLMDFCADTFAAEMNAVLGMTLSPPFNPYANTVNYLVASYVIPNIAVTAYVGAIPNLNSTVAKGDAIIRALLYQRASDLMRPYQVTVAEITERISGLKNTFGGDGVKDEGLVVPQELGPEGMSMGNVLAGDQYSLAYGRTPRETYRIVYATGNESVPGGLFPRGANGRIARSYLPHKE